MKGGVDVMKTRSRWHLAVVLAAAVTVAPAAQTVFPTGTTIFDPDRTWSGFTVLSPLAMQAVPVIDMNWPWL